MIELLVTMNQARPHTIYLISNKNVKLPLRGITKVVNFEFEYTVM